MDTNLVDDLVNLIVSDQLGLNLDWEEAGAADIIEFSPLDFESAVAGPICHSLSTLLGMEPAAVSDILRSIRWVVCPDDLEPHTIDHGTGQSSEIRISWHGSASDLMCLAHEVGHAVQLRLSAGSLMPPLAREACAFLGELALLDWAIKNDPGLATKLLDVWRQENRRYLGDDCDLLRAALADPEALYTYRMNYPLARAAAVLIE